MSRAKTYKLNQRLLGNNKSQNLVALFVFVIVAIVGVYLLASSHAASPYSSSPASSGKLEAGSSGTPTVINNVPGTNSGSKVQFGEPLQPAPAIPATGSGHIYLGAWVNPTNQTTTCSTNPYTGCAELQKLPAFQTAIGVHPAILHFYMGFTATMPTTTLFTSFEQNHSIPLVDWSGGGAGPGGIDCATFNTAPTLQDISSGCEDNHINAVANSLKSFGYPVFLRWDWEMNDSDNAAHTDPTDFVAAWQHIYSQFQADGATNVAFVWCPGLGGGLSTFSSFFPNPKDVDWIAIDGYDRTGQGTSVFASNFASWYSTWSTYNKPMMIAENGAYNTGGGPNGSGTDAEQAAYIAGVQNDLTSGSYNDIKAWVYFDSAGSIGDYSLEGAGLTALTTLANNSYFNFGQ